MNIYINIIWYDIIFYIIYEYIKNIYEIYD